MFKKLKDKAMGALLRRQMKKSGLPEDQQEMLINLVMENPEFFQKIEAEVKEKKNQGMDEQSAMMLVMKSHQSEMQQLMMKMQKGK